MQDALFHHRFEPDGLSSHSSGHNGGAVLCNYSANSEPVLPNVPPEAGG